MHKASCLRQDVVKAVQSNDASLRHDNEHSLRQMGVGDISAEHLNVQR